MARIILYGLGLLAALLAIPTVLACEGADYGTLVESGDDELDMAFVQADDNTDADFTVVQYDPDDDKSGDEEYFLRFSTDNDADEIQVGDLAIATGQIVDSGDDALDYLSSRIDDEFRTTARFLMYTEAGDDFWYFDVDNSGDLTRLDVRLTEVTIEDETYAAGSVVFLSHDDLQLFDTDPDDEVTSINDSDIAWHDEDDDEEINAGDCLLFQPGGFDADAAVGDLRLTGDAPSGSTPDPDENSAPVAGISAEITAGRIPLTVTFVVSVDDADNDDMTWTLDVDGDGTADFQGTDDNDGDEYEFTYDDAGTYTARLVVEDSEGDSDTATLAITAQAAQEVPTPPVGNPTPSATDPTPSDPTDTDGDDDDGSNGVPAPGIPLMALGLAALVVLVRRKD